MTEFKITNKNICIVNNKIQTIIDLNYNDIDIKNEISP